MKDPMETHPQENDPQLARFEAWLKQPTVAAPGNLADRVRARLESAPDGVDPVLDRQFRMDPSLGNPHMVWQVRSRLAAEERQSSWMAWLTPLAAAATLALAFVSFQATGPRPVLETASPERASDNLDLDGELTEILALASALDGTPDVASLESVDALDFLFN